MCQLSNYPDNKPIHGHPYHLVDRSAWPLLTAFAIFFMLLGVVLGLHHVIQPFGFLFFVLTTTITAVLLFFWWGDVIKESFAGYHTEEVARGLRLGFILFIVSEIMFFFSFFWGFFLSFHFSVGLHRLPMATIWHYTNPRLGRTSFEHSLSSAFGSHGHLRPPRRFGKRF